MIQLTNQNINRSIDEVETFLTESRSESGKAIKLRLMLEEVLLNYQERLGKGREFSIQKKKLLGRIQVILSVTGEGFDPFSGDGSEEFLLLRKLHADVDLVTDWSYQNGVNRVSFSLNRQQKFSSTQKTLIALFLGIVLGSVSYELPEAERLSLLKNYIEPTLNTILNIITAVAVPMVFFSLTWGVCTIGDVNTLSRIGKRMIGRFMLSQLLLAAIAVAVCVPFFHGSSMGSSSFQPAEIYALLLSIIPDNLVTPFATGNTVHVITLAVVAGSVLLMMGERVSSLTLFVEHMNNALFYLMSGISALIPFMVFLGLFKITASGQLSVVLQSWKMLLTILVLFILPMLIYTIIVAVRKRVSVIKLIRKAASVFLIGLMTASSSAALAENLERCEHSYGIDEKIVRFGVPLGQTIFMPGAAMFFISISFGMAENCAIAITPNWLVLVTLTSVLLAVALPPIPGGMTMCFTILFGQLNIPLESIGIALALNIVFEYAVTGVNLFCLQMELTELAGSLGMLDLNTLRKS
ncbi:cation:dicarboxylase symporter family transporter [[Clostridium] aminophilum]|uniref:dicarboxylate/amino acid:cation symporter n=1 Tax=[Clostridium] aminophilum TaxID=1526 RepID=UPI0033194C10